MNTTQLAALAITPAQLRRLQVLYAQYAARSLDAENTREARIAFASQRVRRPITSFSALTLDEGKTLIDGLQAALGVKMPSKTPRPRMSRRDGEKAATEGRSDQIHAETTLVSEADHRRIARELDRLGWDQRGMEIFLASKRSPIRPRTVIRTLGDANRVYWALKHIKARPPQPLDRTG